MTASRQLCGRQRIYTEESMITEENIFKVLRESMLTHIKNASDIKFLLDYEKGVQPLVRTKNVRADIDIQVSDNIANQITVFKCGYIWGSPILYVQRGKKDLNGDDPDKQDDGITMLNEMNEIEYSSTKDQELARYVEICGLGYQMVDIRPKFEDSAFELVTLNPMSTFCIYRNSAKQEKIAGVTYCTDSNSGSRYYTVFTDEFRYEVKNEVEFGQDGRKIKDEWFMIERSGELNPLGIIPIVEFNRATDRTGCFERQISDMDALNVEVSDFANTVAQTTQEIWWANDFELPRDSSGKPVKPSNGQWLMTQTIAQGQPRLEPLHSALDLSGVQLNIESKRNLILQKCFVPLQVEANGGSTGSAMSMSAGWSSAETAACMEEQVLRKSKMEIVKLELSAIANTTGVPMDSPLRSLKASDIKPQFTRNKTYDLITKVNGMVTMIKAGINGRVAFETADLFPDVAQAWADSKEMIEEYQKSLLVKNDRLGDGLVDENDMSAQAENSPFINGMNNDRPETDEESAKRDGDV